MLFLDSAPIQRLPGPDLLQKGVSPEGLSIGLASTRQVAFNDHLRRNPGVICPGQPKRFVTGHALKADQGVLNGGRQGVTHVQRARHVGRREHDGVSRFVRLWVSRERAARLPRRIQAPLEFGRFITLG